MKNKYLTKIEDFNLENFQIKLKLLFVDENNISELLDLRGQVIKFDFKKAKYKETTKDGTRKRWFQVLSHILKKQGIIIDSEILNAFHREMKISYFDVIYFDVNGKQIPLVPSINDIDDIKVRIALENIISDFSLIGVDFKDILE